MTPKQAHEELIKAIANAPATIGTYELRSEPNSFYPPGSDAIGEVIALTKHIPKDKKRKGWEIGSQPLREWHENWAHRFGTVAQKLQTGARFAPAEIKPKGPGNEMDPALHNVLADGWHHQPVTQPLDTF